MATIMGNGREFAFNTRNNTTIKLLELFFITEWEKYYTSEWGKYSLGLTWIWFCSENAY